MEFIGGPADGLVTTVAPVTGGAAPPLFYDVPTPAPPRDPPDPGPTPPPRTALYRRGRDTRDTGRDWCYRYCREETR